MSSTSGIIHAELASHLRVSPAFLHDALRLREDLGLTNIDLAWIVMRVETLELGSDEFPLETLDTVQTIGELDEAFDDWLCQRDTYEDIRVDRIAMVAPPPSR